MVARAERAHLVALALVRSRRDETGIAAGHPAAFLDALEIARLAPARAHRPGRSVAQHLVEPLVGQVDRAGRADPRRHGRIQRLGQFLLVRHDPFGVDIRQHGAHAAGNVEADAAARHHAAVIRIEGGDPADREAVAPMRVRHGVGGAHDARQGGDIRRLFVDLVVHLADQRLVAIEDRRHAHLPRRLDMPFALACLFQPRDIHGCLPPLTRRRRIARSIRRACLPRPWPASASRP
jgi:hypothetical protein